MKRLQLEAGARAELLHETKYYEATRRGTGHKFREAVGEVFSRIRRTPEAGKPDEEDCRRFRVKGVPFSVVYREADSEIVVFAIRADAREPGYWLTRTK